MLTASRTHVKLFVVATAAMSAIVCATLAAPAKVHVPSPAQIPRVSVQTLVQQIDYNRDIRPILSSNCFACHGKDPKAVQAGLRLDNPTDASKKLANGERAIVPKDATQSELVFRINAPAPLLMPPPSSHKILDAAEKKMLTRWVASGAVYKPHWAFIKPIAPPLPPVKLTKWPENSIDRFVLANLEAHGLSPSPPTDRTTLIRRVTLDLNGVPPTPEEINAYTNDRSHNAYEKVVDRLLSSPRYGEHMAAGWMDEARYADSNGYQADYERYQWRWRDWVINAYNQNMPYNEFALEQIAGDMLPDATVSQKLATGFNRNHRINTEGGVIPEEWRTETVIDRVETTSAVFLGLTMGCARCHDHKYDPIPQKDFYGFYAYFNNVPETGSGVEMPVNHPPFISTPTDEMTATIQGLRASIAATKLKIARSDSGFRSQAVDVLKLTPDASRLNNGLVTLVNLDPATTKSMKVGKPTYETSRHASGTATFDGTAAIDSPNVGDFERTDSFSYGCYIKPTDGNESPISRMDVGDAYRGYDIFMSGGKVSVHIIHHWPDNAIKVTLNRTIPNNEWSHVFVTYDGSGKANGVKIYVDGTLADQYTENDTLSDSIRTARSFRAGGRTGGDMFKGSVDDVRVYNRTLSASDVRFIYNSGPLSALESIPAEKRTGPQNAELAKSYRRANDPEYGALLDSLSDFQSKLSAAEGSVPTTMVMEEMPKPRVAKILLRGQYDHPGAEVTAHIPTALGTLPAGRPNNRLGLAYWITSNDNPLTARVAVNHLWEKFFGVGIVQTSEDFGVRAEFPSNPALLDWLATDFMRKGWNLKAMQKEMVMSATYRQSSRATPAQWRSDPDNRLLARGPRFRLPAEVIRDQALFASGLLVEKRGGPSVRPYQPDGLWDELSVYGNLRNYQHDKDSGLYRRSLYTIWKRTVAPPLMTLFDVPGRDTCRVRRGRTDTPLQALALLNDPTFVEASRVLAENMLMHGGPTVQSRINYGFGKLVGRHANNREVAILSRGIHMREVHYRSDPKGASMLVHIGDSAVPKTIDIAKLAAYTTAASVMLNMDETITKE